MSPTTMARLLMSDVGNSNGSYFSLFSDTSITCSLSPSFRITRFTSTPCEVSVAGHANQEVRSTADEVGDVILFAVLEGNSDVVDARQTGEGIIRNER